jgi:hypothetical protein
MANDNSNLVIVDRKMMTKGGKSVTFLFLKGYPGAQEDQISIFEQTPKSERTTSAPETEFNGYAWGPNFSSVKDAIAFLQQQGYDSV